MGYPGGVMEMPWRNMRVLWGVMGCLEDVMGALVVSWGCPRGVIR